MDSELCSVGVDIGGTFTDLVYHTAQGLRVHKLLTTRQDESLAFLQGLDALEVAAQAQVAHGTTVATNALLEHRGARTALIVTAGFGDILTIGRQARPALYRLSFAPRFCPAPEELTGEVAERVLPTGEILLALDPAEARRVVEECLQRGAESLAVCLLFSFANPQHEQMIGEIAAQCARERQRSLFVSLSSEILPEYREFERASTTVLNAYVAPILGRYLENLEQGLLRRGHRSLWVMQSSGGILSANAARREAVRSLLSGPAAGVTGAFHTARQAGFDHLITFDMGGTSTDVSLLDGAIRRTSEGSVEGWPARTPMMDIHTVGAGGGSIAWVDSGGALRVGPQSAGSQPGPACYGRGGSEAPFTVTDANLLLGRLHPDYFLGGRMRLDRAAAQRSAAPLADRLGMSQLALARGVIRIANAHIEQALRVISVERGFDPRAFTLLPFGGAGPMHALDLAAALHIRQVLIPRYPGVLSALGLTLADYVKDYSQTVMWPLAQTDLGLFRQAFAPLLQRAAHDLAQEGFQPAEIHFEPAVDLRYKGQSFELTIALEVLPEDSSAGAIYQPAALAARLFAAHQQRYGYAVTQAVEVVTVRLAGRGLRPQAEESALPASHAAAKAVAQTGIMFDEHFRPAAVYAREHLQPGHKLQGAAMIVQEDATSIIPPGWSGQVDERLNLIFRPTNGTEAADA